MKLSIGENIRALRRKMDMTQEELADKLCVSLQVVSRWETGATYPPLDVIPAMSNFFGVTADELIGVPKTDDGKAPYDFYKRLNCIGDQEKLVEYLKEGQRDYPRDYDILCDLCWEVKDNRERRQYAEKLLKECNNARLRASVTLAVVGFETDEKELAGFLDRYSTGENMSRAKLMLFRYEYLKDYSKYEPLKQLLSYHWLTNDVFSYLTPNYPQTRSADVSLRGAEIILKIMNVLTDMECKNLITGDGIPDLWIEVRWHFGLRYCCYLSGTGRIEEALSGLEEITDYIERFFSLPEGTVLDFRSFSFPALEGEKLRPYFKKDPFVGEEYLIYEIPIRAKNGEVIDEKCSVNIAPSIDFYPLTIDRGWEWFDPIRNTDRFKACLERLKKFEKTVPFDEG